MRNKGIEKQLFIHENNLKKFCTISLIESFNTIKPTYKCMAFVFIENFSLTTGELKAQILKIYLIIVI